MTDSQDNVDNLDSEKETYCICNQEYIDGEFMLKCDGPCGDWFHPKCLNLTPEQEAIYREVEDSPFYCHACIGSKNICSNGGNMSATNGKSTTGQANNGGKLNSFEAPKKRFKKNNATDQVS